MQPIILVPYRDRASHFRYFLPAIKKFLPNGIVYVIEQADNEPFNRGWLLNVGFIETENIGDFWITHDVDMIPVRADYSFPEVPTHIATRCSQFRYKMPYNEYFGGVVLFTAKHFRDVNGFVNNLRGWGAEDDILYSSFFAKGYLPERRDCIFKSLPHKRLLNKIDYNYNMEVYNKGRDINDGISSCKYTVIDKLIKPDYTHLFVT